MIENLGKGLVPQPVDKRDYNFAMVAASAPPIDWTKEFRRPEPPNENQGIADDCVAHAVSYLHWAHKGKRYSRRDLFSRIALMYGAYLRDGMQVVCKVGQQTRDECPDPMEENPQNMRIRCTPDTAGMDDLEAGFFAGGESIEQMAQAVRDFKGAVFGVKGDNAGWFDLTNPEPPRNEEWAHALCAFGYHTHNGQKCIIGKSSWCGGNHHEHHIRENYFISGNVFNNWVLVPKESQPMTKVFKIEDHGKQGVLVLEGFTGNAMFADTSETYDKLLSIYGRMIASDSPVIQVP
jgi:hypothetical protein